MTLAEVVQTANEVYNPDDGIDLLGLLILGLPALVAAIGTIFIGWLTVRGQKRGRERAKKADAKTDEIHWQTVNDHSPKSNLRDDIDKILAFAEEIGPIRELVKDMSDRQIANSLDIRGIRTDVGELRGADRDFRKEHDGLVKRLNAFIRREHPGADPL